MVRSPCSLRDSQEASPTPQFKSINSSVLSFVNKGLLSDEIKRRLLFGRKVMTNLDSIFKSRNITLPTKARLVKAMVFPVVIYQCEIWTLKKAEHQRIDALNCGVEKTLESPLNCKEIQPVSSKGNES